MPQDAIFYPDPWPQQRSRKIAPFTLVYGNEPPRKAALALTALVCINAWNPPDPQPTQKRVQIAPLTLRYGDQPPPRRFSQLLSVIQFHWEAGPNRAQVAAPNAGWNYAPTVTSFVPYTSSQNVTIWSQWNASWNASGGVQLSAPTSAWNPAGVEFSGVTKLLYSGVSLPQYLARDVSYHDIVSSVAVP